LAEIYYCPNPECPHRLAYGEAYYTEFPGFCPYCDSELEPEE